MLLDKLRFAEQLNTNIQFNNPYYFLPKILSAHKNILNQISDNNSPVTGNSAKE